jgi:hypothetical protein
MCVVGHRWPSPINTFHRFAIGASRDGGSARFETTRTEP